MQKTIAVVFGGNSYEHDISIVTGLIICNELKKIGCCFIPVYLSREGIFYSGKALFNKENYENRKGFLPGQFMIKNNLPFFIGKKKKSLIDFVLPCWHGKGTEDGTLGGFFDALNIPVCYSGVMMSGLIQNKFLFKKYMELMDLDVVPYIFTTKGNYLNDIKSIFDSEFYIVKPNNLGSSIGVSKCSKEYLLQSAEQALMFDNEILIEKMIDNLEELNIAICGSENEIVLSEIEKVNGRQEVLSYQDKYEEFAMKNEKQLPAVISKQLRKKICDISKNVFCKLGLEGVVRFDYLYDKKRNELFLNEINSIPGSLSLYLFEAQGISSKEFFQRLRMIAIKRHRTRNLHLNVYKESRLLQIKGKKV